MVHENEDHGISSMNIERNYVPVNYYDVLPDYAIQRTEWMRN